ncbi:MAG: PadR family transcriptional regulator [Nitrospirales bacterium]|nr:helix-turn-helix transcriptional regulator [Nitrospira sp.]MDR4460357.1 PadR family transcriptional regulator [Nitrospirales bacterium]
MREALILAILREGNKYGREIRDECETRAGHNVPLGSLYTTLSRMEEKGLIRSHTEKSSAGRGGNRRNYYQITGAGQIALSEYVQKSDYLLNLVPNYD